MKVLSRKNVFSNFLDTGIEGRLTISEIITELNIPNNLHDYLDVRVNGVKISSNFWQRTRPNKNTLVTIQVIPRGGDFGEFFKIAVTIAVIVTVAIATNGMGPGWSAGLVAAASIGTTLALNAIFPPPVPTLSKGAIGSSSAKRVDAVTSQSNVIDQYGPCIRSYGRNKIYPRVAAQPYAYFIGNDSYLITIYDLGIGDYVIDEETIKIGNTDLVYFENVSYNIVRPKKGDEFKYYVNTVQNESLAVNYDEVNDSAVRTTKVDTDFFQIDLFFPQGLAGIDSSGKYVNNTVKTSVQFRKVGDIDWINYYNVDFDLDSRFSSFTYINTDIFFSEIYVASGANYKWNSLYDEGEYPAWFHNTCTYSYFSDYLNIALDVGDIVYYKGVSYTVQTVDGGKSYFDQPINFSGVIKLGTLPQQEDPRYNPFTKIVFVIKKRLNSGVTISSNSTAQFITSLTVYPGERAQYEIRVTLSEIYKNGSGANNFYKFSWATLKSYSKNEPIRTNVEHTFLELKIKASDQLNGQVDSLSVQTTSLLEVYDQVTKSWNKLATNNPAWIFVDLLTGELNQRAISKDRIDIVSILEWAKYCDENVINHFGELEGFSCNFVLDYRTPLRELLNQVCSSARASLSIFDGKYGVVIDQLRNQPVQVFTLRNIISFKSARSYSDIPHAIKCRYIDPFSDWQVNEVVAYDDGYDEYNATLFEEIDVFGCTSNTLAWRQGRYFIAQSRLRQEQIEIRVGVDNLACTRGDLVRLQVDTMKVGGKPVRIKAKIGNYLKLDESVDTDPLLAYMIEARHSETGKLIKYNNVGIISHDTLLVNNASLFKEGDLILFGESNKTAIDCIVKSIITEGDLNATIYLQEYAPEIFNADIGIIPNYKPVMNSNINGDSNSTAPGAVVDLSYNYSVTCATTEKRYKYTINLSWTQPNNLVAVYEVYVSTNNQTVLAGISKSNSFVYYVKSEDIGAEHTVSVIAVSGTGEKLDLRSSSFVKLIPTEDSQKPEDVKNFNANILTERIELEWSSVSDCDVDRYIIKFFPETVDARWSISEKIAEVSANTLNKSVPLRTGTYLIKAQDWAGNTSENATRIITSIPEDEDIKLEQELSVPNFDGKFENTQLYNGKLILSANSDYSKFNYKIGYFYFNQLFDLGDIYKARFESSIVSGGFSYDSILKNWSTLSSVSRLAGKNSDGIATAEVEIRVQGNKDTLKDWVKLSDVKFLAYGTESSSGPWKKLTVGDYTGHRFQVRIKLATTNETISPIVYSANVKAFFPSRTTSGEDGVSGVRINFKTAFKYKPSLTFTTLQNLASGDSYEIIELDEAGFKVQFIDKNGINVDDRTFDWKARGYGIKYIENDLIYS